jgi:hypothetical protein
MKNLIPNSGEDGGGDDDDDNDDDDKPLIFTFNLDCCLCVSHL